MRPRDHHRLDSAGPPWPATRRELLRAGGCGLVMAALAACTGPGSTPAPSSPQQAVTGLMPPADRRAVAGLVAAHQGLAARYAEIARHASAAPARRLARTLRRSHVTALHLLEVPTTTRPASERPASPAVPATRPAGPLRPDWAALARTEADTATLALETVTRVSPRTAARVARIGADGQADAARLAVGPAGQISAATAAARSSRLPAGTLRVWPPDVVARVLDVARGEDAAVWGYQVVAARARPGAERALADACLAAHRTARDRAALWAARSGQRPPAPAAGYALPPLARRAGGHVELAQLLERRTGGLWAGLVPLTEGPARRVPAVALAGARTRETLWAQAAG